MTSRRYFPVKNNKNFSWHDDGTVKDRRRPNEKHYRFFFLNIIHNRDIMLFNVHVFAIFIFNFDPIFYRL